MRYGDTAYNEKSEDPVYIQAGTHISGVFTHRTYRANRGLVFRLVKGTHTILSYKYPFLTDSLSPSHAILQKIVVASLR